MRSSDSSSDTSDSSAESSLGYQAENAMHISGTEEALASGDIASETMREAVRDFLIESQDSLSQIEGDMVLLEKEPDSSSIINNVFRSVHTIKGTAGFLAFRQIEKLTHAGENILGAIRNNQLGFDSTICTELLSMVDLLKKYLATVEATGTEGNTSCESQVVRMAQLLDRLLVKQTAEPLTTKPVLAASLAVSPLSRNNTPVEPASSTPVPSKRTVAVR